MRGVPQLQNAGNAKGSARAPGKSTSNRNLCSLIILATGSNISGQE